MKNYQHNDLVRSFYVFSLILVLVSVAASYVLAGFTRGNELQSAVLGLYTVFQYAIMSVAMCLAWWLMSASADEKMNKKYLSLLLVVAVIARIMLLGVDPYTSNDVDRYLFDGKIALEGFDPYRTAHNDISLIALREQWQPPAEHAGYATLYPPLALAFFSLCAMAGVEHAQLAWKVVLLTSSLATLWLSVLILKKANKIQHIALVALSPLLILETGVGLHLDALSTLTICLAIYYWQRNKNALTGLMLGLGVLIKLLPAMLLMPLFLLHKNNKPPFQMIIAFFLTVASGYGTLLALGFKPIGSIDVFFQKWRFASPIYYFFEGPLATSTLTTLVAIIAISTLSVIGLACYFSAQKSAVKTQAKNRLNHTATIKSSNNNFYYFQASMAVPLILSPVIFPWYVLPLVPLLALQPNIYLLLWITLLPMTYEVIGQFNCCGLWAPAAWPIYLLTLVYITFFIALLMNVIPRFLQWRHQKQALNRQLNNHLTNELKEKK